VEYFVSRVYLTISELERIYSKIVSYLLYSIVFYRNRFHVTAVNVITHVSDCDCFTCYAVFIKLLRNKISFETSTFTIFYKNASENS
jgi:hypothetical protein